MMEANIISYYKYFLVFRLKLKVIKGEIWRKYEDREYSNWEQFNIFPSLKDYIIERG